MALCSGRQICRPCRLCSVHTMSSPARVWFTFGDYCAPSLMHANPMTLAVCGSRFLRDCRGGAGRSEGSGPNTREVLDTLRCPPSKNPQAKTRPLILKDELQRGIQQRWHSQVAAYSTVTASTMGRNYRTSAPSVFTAPNGFSTCTLQGLCRKVQSERFQSVTFDLKKMAGSTKLQ